MKRFSFLIRFFILLGTAAGPAGLQAEETAPTLAARLAENVRDGSSVVRLKLEGGQPDPALQLRIKSRRTAAGTDVMYQVLWPKERKGEGFVIRQSAGGAPSGNIFVPPSTLRSLTAAELDQTVFGSDLGYLDLVENFFAWERQTLTGQEVVDRVPCQILESKPGSGDRSGYGLVRSWVDTKRLVTLRVEKFNRSGQMVRRITTTKVTKDDTGHHVAASLVVQRAGKTGQTSLEGSNSQHGAASGDSDFAPEALRALAK